MSISYRFAKMNARTIEASQNFKQYIGSHLFEYKGIMGLSLVNMIIFRQKSSNSTYRENRARYLPFQKANDAMLALTLGPILLGATGTFASVMAIFGVLIMDNMQYPWILLFATIFWNIFFLNFGPILARYILPRREVYFDRINQTVSFTWSVDNAQKNEHGHATFPFSDIEAFYAKANHSQGHGVTHAMYVA
ncbi:hypothetical protein, partial [Pseudoalteromonas sp. bablab_jr011]|uniref:hypothetical protein n=1 Tax=Pseudoalteromonas sp. bablab_jr011 TaxID=2755062 RepID=UPI0018F597A5